MDSFGTIFWALVGCFAAALYTRDSPSAVDKLKRLFPGRDERFYERADLFLLIVFGTALAYWCRPLDQLRAIGAGLGAVSAMKQTLQTPRAKRIAVARRNQL